MYWLNSDISHLPREGAFPFPVRLLYTSTRDQMNGRTFYGKFFEVSLRLNSTVKICRDRFDGVEVSVPFPNVAYKFPGMGVAGNTDGVRDTIAFAYDAETLERFRELGFVPEDNCIPLSVSPVLQKLIQELRKAIFQLYLPGTPDRIDWICFQIVRELHYSKFTHIHPQKLQEKIADMAVWLQMHYDSDIDFPKLAEKYSLSKSTFYREWMKYFQITPLQYLLELRLENARRLLQSTDMTIAEICQAVNFSCTSAFHNKFAEKYGETPKQYREAISNSQFSILNSQLFDS